MIKQLLRPLIPNWLLERNRKRFAKKLEEEKQKLPTFAEKQAIIQLYQQKSGYKVLVETGTYLGDTLAAQKENFDKLYSIELSQEFFEKASERFQNDAKVTILQGNSAEVLYSLLKDVTGPVVFWLDAHYSFGTTAKGDKDCPIFEELDAIFDVSPLEHVLLIDDARLFNGTGDYPTIEKLEQLVKTKNKNYKLQVEKDIIRFEV